MGFSYLFIHLPIFVFFEQMAQVTQVVLELPDNGSQEFLIPLPVPSKSEMTGMPDHTWFCIVLGIKSGQAFYY